MGCTLVDVSGATGIPAECYLGPNNPNPFNPATEIRFALPATGSVRLTVHDVAGRLVTVLHQGPLRAGSHTIAFDGRTDTGMPLASGTYFYRLEAGPYRQTRPMLLLK